MLQEIATIVTLTLGVTNQIEIHGLIPCEDKSFFKCFSYESQGTQLSNCMIRELICDGKNDCYSGEDEIHCIPTVVFNINDNAAVATKQASLYLMNLTEAIIGKVLYNGDTSSNSQSFNILSVESTEENDRYGTYSSSMNLNYELTTFTTPPDENHTHSRDSKPLIKRIWNEIINVANSSSSLEPQEQTMQEIFDFPLSAQSKEANKDHESSPTYSISQRDHYHEIAQTHLSFSKPNEELNNNVIVHTELPSNFLLTDVKYTSDNKTENVLICSTNCTSVDGIQSWQGFFRGWNILVGIVITINLVIVIISVFVCCNFNKNKDKKLKICKKKYSSQSSDTCII